MNTKPSFYLVQRLELKKNCELPLTDKKVSDVLSLDYMGSTEFEWRAFPKCLRSINENKEKMQQVEMTINSVKIFVVFDSSVYTEEEVRNQIQLVADNKTYLKEYSSFPPSKEKYSRDTSAWLEIHLNVFWTLHKIVADNFLTFVENSVVYMDECKKLAEQV